jgi:hypothetical protein
VGSGGGDVLREIWEFEEICEFEEIGEFGNLWTTVFDSKLVQSSGEFSRRFAQIFDADNIL